MESKLCKPASSAEVYVPKLPKFLNELNALEILPLQRGSRDSQDLDFI